MAASRRAVLSEATFWRRVTDLYEVDQVKGGFPVGRSLFRWHAADDRFERQAEPQQWGQDRSDLALRSATLAELAAAGRTSTADVATAVAQYRTNGG